MQSRRDFLKNISIFSAAAPSLFAAATQAQSQAADYKAIVCVLLDGGNDATNMVVPTQAEHYAQYQAIRELIAIPQAELLPIPATGKRSDGQAVTLGLHPSMTKFAEICNQGAGTIIANSGTLIEPITKQEYEAESKAIPPFLFSHNSQKLEWSKGGVGEHLLTGWAGRLMDVLGNNNSQGIAPLYSCNGDNLLLRSQKYTQNIIKGDNITKLRGNDKNRASILAMGEQAHLDPFHHTLRSTLLDARNVAETLIDLVADTHTVGEGDQAVETPNFPDELGFDDNSNLQVQLKTVSRFIKRQVELQQQRQIFFVRIGGFDTHINQDEEHHELLGHLSDALAIFHQQLKAYGYDDKVLTMTISDFGRRVPSNGTGTDHGWGGHQLLMGSAVNHEAFIGTWPDLDPEGNDCVERGRLLPSTGAEQIFASLARWMGATETTVKAILPNAHKFEPLVITA